MVPGNDVELIRRWASTRYPVRLRNEMRAELEVSESGVDVYECRPPWPADAGLQWSKALVVRFEFAHDRWSILWRDSLGRLLPFTPAPSSSSIAELLEVVDDDTSGVFWG